MSVKGLSRRGTGICYDIDLENMLYDSSLPFDYLVSDNKEEYFDKTKLTKMKKKIEPINEVTRKEIIQGADSARKKRAEKLTTRYGGVTNTRGWIKFVTNSQYTPGLKYTQYIKLAEAKDMKYFKEFNKRDIIRLFLSGDLQVHCTCPDYRYRMKYMAYNMGYGIYKEMRYPKIRNPKLKGTVCKHLLCVLSVLQMNWTSIARDMQKTKFFKKKYDNNENIGGNSKTTKSSKSSGN